MELDFETEPITEQEVIAILGNNFKRQGDELVWRCPACPGGDKSGDNLKFNRTKGIIKCFACDYGSDITGIIARRRYAAAHGEDLTANSYVAPPPPIVPPAPPVEVEKEKAIPEDELDAFYWNSHIALMKRKDILRQMFERHTILPKTAAECMIGYSEEKDMLVFPSKAIGKDPTEALLQTTGNGAEYREYKGSEKIVRRVSGYEPKICTIYATAFTMHAIICEGYKDAYNLVQLLKMTNPEQLSYTAIFTVQNGTNSINTNGCLQKSNWKRFDVVELLMDNDKAGDKAIETARSFFPEMVDARDKYIKGYNDVQQRFKEEFASRVDIEKALSASWLAEYENEQPIL